MRPSFKLSTLVLLPSLIDAAIVKLGETTLVGEDVTSQGLEFFGGIPFAEPPIGNLRLKPPVLKISLNVSTFNATTFGASCLQVPIFGSPDLSSIKLAEDCLFVNVIRPAGIDNTTLLPVLVYIYGGGFTIDAPPQINGSAIVARSVARGTPVIYAGLNYRLGPLGFPTGAEALEKGALNLGLKDQSAALEWIQHNIGAFRGDKDKVTIFGLSAGSISIGTHFLGFHIEKYARAAILESGVAGTTLTFNATRRQDVWDNFIAALPECQETVQGSTFDCLRGDIDATHFLQAIRTSLDKAPEQYPWVPNLDGPDGLLPELPSEMLKKGNFSKIPVIIGNALDEGTLFAAATSITTEQGLRDALITNLTVSPGSSAQVLDNAVDTILKLYSEIPALGSPYNTGNETFGLSTQYKRLSSIYGDTMFQFPRRAWTKVFAQAGVKTYGYQFSYPELNPDPAVGVAHGSELSYVFGFSFLPPEFVPSPAATRASEQIIDYWVSFATSLDPNDGLGSERPVWPQYSIEDPILLQLNGSSTGPLADTYRNEQFDFVDSNAIVFRH
ncbi:hypothetical protein VNI00_009788 [Paramarasmius palmivorus]|uniref:Carboxylic ester hydrolase n=1 Tax=Paramarasmius palmivorus TaxID=297713 RepID=A0AAW0CP52_9AGAR